MIIYMYRFGGPGACGPGPSGSVSLSDVVGYLYVLSGLSPSFSIVFSLLFFEKTVVNDGDKHEC